MVVLQRQDRDVNWIVHQLIIGSGEVSLLDFLYQSYLGTSPRLVVVNLPDLEDFEELDVDFPLEESFKIDVFLEVSVPLLVLCLFYPSVDQRKSFIVYLPQNRTAMKQ
ncbi:hypothetical protein Tco_0285339 [Tanacetum coccineum]